MLKRSQKATKTSETMWNKGSSCFACRGSQFVQPCGCRESFRKASRRETWLHCTVFVCLFWVSSLWFFGTVSLLDSQSVLFLSATERWIHRDTMVDLLACHMMFYNKSIYIYMRVNPMYRLYRFLVPWKQYWLERILQLPSLSHTKLCGDANAKNFRWLLHW